MKSAAWIGRVTVAAALGAAGWVVLFHPDRLEPARHEEEVSETVETEVAVHVATVTRATLRKIVEAHGTVVPEPASASRPPASARVASPVAGIVAVSSAVEGERVARNQVLFRLDDRVARSEEEKARAAVERAQVALGYARKALDRQRRLLSEDATAVRRFEEAELQNASAEGELAAAEKVLFAARTARSLLEITAPLSGTITHVRVNPGESIDVNAGLADLVDLDRLVVQANVPAREATALARGQRVEIVAQTEAAADPKSPVMGQLDFVGLEVDPRSDSVPVRVTIPPDRSPRLGTYVRVRIVVEERTGRLAVPSESVVVADDGAATVSVLDGTRAVRRRVKTGIRDGELVEIEGEGIETGTRVVSSGAYGLPKETNVRILEK